MSNNGQHEPATNRDLAVDLSSLAARSLRGRLVWGLALSALAITVLLSLVWGGRWRGGEPGSVPSPMGPGATASPATPPLTPPATSPRTPKAERILPDSAPGTFAAESSDGTESTGGVASGSSASASREFKPFAASPARIPPPPATVKQADFQSEGHRFQEDRSRQVAQVAHHEPPPPVGVVRQANLGPPVRLPLDSPQHSFVSPAQQYVKDDRSYGLGNAVWESPEYEPHVFLVDTESQPPIRPPVLREPLPDTGGLFPEGFGDDRLFDPDNVILQYPREAPLGFTGRSGILPQEIQTDSHFVPVEDRWREGFPTWDRYGWGHPLGYDYPYKHGRWWDPYNQNVLKGDFPIIGQHTFFDLTVESISLVDTRQVPTATTPFESTLRPGQFEFFGRPNQLFYLNPLFVSFELFHGDAGFKQKDWSVRITPAFNVNHLGVQELAIVNPDVRKGTRRTRTFWTLEEWFVESKLFDIGTSYDFASVRAGSQFFVSDFRGFVFNDVNRSVRLFGTNNSNREQFNLIWFDQTEKDTNSQLNSFDDRHQNTLIANYFYQDFIWPGYTTQLSFHYNLDEATMEFDDNNFLVRPDPVGVFRPHEVNSYYLGWAGDGHINRMNISHAFYWVLGDDELNPIAGKPQKINAQMAAVELSVDRDWARFRTSFFWSSGDNDPNDGQAEGFDAIFDNPNFAGGEFSFWQRQAIQLFGVRLVNDRSLVPNLRSSRVQGQTNFVNPGLLLGNVGLDMDLTPKTKVITNGNLLWFDHTEVLELFTFQGDIHDFIGADLSLGIEYRPLLNDNIEIVGGISGLIPGRGFKDLYNPLRGEVGTLMAGFVEVILIY